MSLIKWFFFVADSPSLVKRFTIEETVIVDTDLVTFMTFVIVHSGNFKVIKKNRKITINQMETNVNCILVKLSLYYITSSGLKL